MGVFLPKLTFQILYGLLANNAFSVNSCQSSIMPLHGVLKMCWGSCVRVIILYLPASEEHT